MLLQAGVFTDLGSGLTVYVRARDGDGSLRGVLVHDTRDREKPITYTAARGILYGGPTGPQIVMENGSYQETSGRTGAVSILNFDHAAIALSDLMGTTDERYREPQERFVGELLRSSRSLPEAERQRLAAEVVAFVQRLRREDLFKRPGVAETIDWAGALTELDQVALDAAVVSDTLGVLLKYQDDIARIEKSQTKALLDEVKAELAAAE